MYLYLMCKIENMFFFGLNFKVMIQVRSKFRLAGDSRSVSTIETDQSGNGGNDQDAVSRRGSTM